MHKKTQILNFLFIIIFVVSAGKVDSVESRPIEIQLEESNSNYVILKLEIPNFQFDEVQYSGQSWQTISFPGCAYTSAEGKPKLPIKTTLIGVPPEAEIGLQLLDSDYSSRKIARVVPVKDVSVGPIYNQSSIVNRQSSIQRVVELGFTGYIRDSRVVQIRFNPVQYNPATGTVKLYHRLRAKVVFVRISASPSVIANPSPESKTFKQILKRNILNYDVSKNWQSGKTARRQSLSKTATPVPHFANAPGLESSPSSAHSCRVYVDEDGIYSIGYEQLKEALPKLLEINPRTFKMYNKGKQIPIYVRGETDGSFDRNDEIIFYGEHNRGKHAYYDRYSVENVYWLQWTGKIGTRMIEHKSSPDFSRGKVEIGNVLRYRKYKHRVHIEKNNLFMRLPQAVDNIDGNYHYERDGYIIHRDSSMFLPLLPFDNWYWDQIGAPNLKSYSFELSSLAETSLSASVRLSLRGRTDNPAKPDHHTQVWLNGTKLLEDAKWDGQETHLFESDEISQDYLVNGTNKIMIICPGDTQAKEIDQVLLDWIEVEYWREYEAVGDVLEFSVPIKPEFIRPQSEVRAIISGFSTNNIEIYGTDGSRYSGIAVVEDEQSSGKYKAIFRVQASVIDPNVRYIALTDDKFKKPKAVIKDEPSYLRSSANGADYIIITHDDFSSGVSELAEWRAAQGLRVAVVTVQNIYDEFNYGILNPHAIRDFLSFAYQNWRPPAPSFVTLVGDAKNIKPTPSDELLSLSAYVPTTLVRSNKYGAVASDFQFSLINGDDALADIVVSRLPVNNMIELSDAVEKVIAYEKHKILGPWRKRLLFLAGSGGVNFSNQSEQLIKSYVPQPFEISRVYSDDPKSSYYGDTIDVIDEINSGNLVVNFIGHGGGGIWSDNRMMGLEDVELLENEDSFPFILSMTCFTGYFDNQHRLSLGEKMVIAEKKGAIGFLGATGLGWVYGDYWFAREIFDSLFAISEQTTIGSIVTDAKINFISKYPNYIDIANMFTLLGDSAQAFSLPQSSIAVRSSGEIESNKLLEINGSIEDSSLQYGNLEITVSSPSDEEGEAIQLNRITTLINDKQFSLQTQIPSVSESGVGIIKAYAWSENTDAIGATTYSIGLPHVSNIRIEPPIKLNSKSYLYASAYGTEELFLHTYWSYNPEKDWAKVPMSKVKDNLYRTDSPLPSDSRSAVYYYLQLTDTEGRTTKTERRYYRIYAYPDLTFTEKKIRWIVDTSSVLSTEVKNIGDQSVNDVVVRFYDGSIDKKNQIGEDQIINVLNSDDYTTVQIPWEPKSDQHTIFVEIDPDKKIREQNEFNNVMSEQFSGSRFSLSSKNSTDGVIRSLDGNLMFNLASGKIQKSAILEIKKLGPIPLNQPELKYVPLPKNPDGAVYSLTLISDSNETVVDYRLSADLSIKPDLNQISNVNNLKIQWYDENTSKWVLAGKNSVENDKVKALISSDGLYALMESNDHTPPEIDITIEHQGFIPGSYVSENPVITVALRDINGIDIRENSACEIPERLMLVKDQTKVDRSEYSVSASPVQSGLILMAYSPNLSPGQHTLTVQAFDSSGNLGEDSIEFQVAGELEIKKIANYPNPMKPGNSRSRGQGTIFAYILTKSADRVSLKIYTGSGRLVKSFDTLDVFADYNEFFWNGLDEDGDELSNGVYFYKMKAERDGKVAEKVGKLAILR